MKRKTRKCRVVFETFKNKEKKRHKITTIMMWDFGLEAGNLNKTHTYHHNGSKINLKPMKRAICPILHFLLQISKSTGPQRILLVCNSGMHEETETQSV